MHTDSNMDMGCGITPRCTTNSQPSAKQTPAIHRALRIHTLSRIAKMRNRRRSSAYSGRTGGWMVGCRRCIAAGLNGQTSPIPGGILLCAATPHPIPQSAASEAYHFFND